MKTQYSVIAAVNFIDEKAFCRSVEELSKRYRLYGYDEHDFSTPYSCFQFLCFDTAEVMDDDWFANFHASDLYEPILAWIFSDVKGLADGSEITISTEEQSYILTMENNKIHTKIERYK